MNAYAAALLGMSMLMAMMMGMAAITRAWAAAEEAD